MNAVLALSDAMRYNLGLALILVCATIMAVVAYRSWSEAHEDLDPVSQDELLASFQQARAEGEIDDEEYERVRQQLGDELPDKP